MSIELKIAKEELQRIINQEIEAFRSEQSHLRNELEGIQKEIEMLTQRAKDKEQALDEELKKVFPNRSLIGEYAESLRRTNLRISSLKERFDQLKSHFLETSIDPKVIRIVLMLKELGYIK